MDDTVTADSIETADGARIRLEIDGTVDIVVESGGEVRRRCLPYPSHGFGGHRFVLSPNERWLAFAFYSGQSEEAYHLLSYPELEVRWSQPYVFGESGLSLPAFTPDGTRLVAAWATNSGLRIESLEERIDGGELKEGSITDSVEVIDWCVLHVRDLASGAIQECAVHVRMPAGSPDYRDPECWPELGRIEDGRVGVRKNWGEELVIQLPPPGKLIIDGPTPG